MEDIGMEELGYGWCEYSVWIFCKDVKGYF